MAMPVALLAIVNGSDSRERAVQTHRYEPVAVRDAWRAPVVAFAEIAASKTRPSSAGIWDYPSQQAKLCLGHLLERERRYGQGVRIWVPTRSRSDTLCAIATELRIAQSTPESDAIHALAAFAAAYERVCQQLERPGLAFSTAPERRQLIKDAEEALRAVKTGA